MRKQTKYLSHVIAFFLMLAMMLPNMTPIQAHAAEDLYLAFQNDENGTGVVKLKSADRKAYRVDELFMNVGEQVDLCFINASAWTNPQWTSSDNSVVKVNGAGVVTAVAPGVARVTLTYSKWWGTKVSATATFYVGEENWDIHIGGSSLTCVLDNYELKVGSRIELDLFEEKLNPNLEQRSSYAKKPWNDVIWKCSDENVVKLYGQRLVAEKTGKAKITAIITNKVLRTSIVKNITVNVTEPAYDEFGEWNNKYYQMYGENYKRLFQTEGLKATLDIERDLLDDTWSAWSDKMQAINISGFAELTDVANGLTIAFESILNGKNYHVEEGHRQAVLYLLQKMSDTDGINEHYVNTTEKALKKAQGIIEDIDNLSEITEIVNELEMAGLEIPNEEQKSITEYVMNEAAGKIESLLSEGVTITEYLALTMCLYEMDSKLLDDLQNCSKLGDALYNDIELIRAEKEKNPVQYFKENYCSDAFARIASQILIKLAGEKAIGVLSVAGDLVNMVIDMNGVAKLSALTKTTYLMEYTASVQDKVDQLRTEIKENFDSYTNEELQKKIDEYESAYRIYLSLVEITIGAVREELKLQNNDEIYKDECLISSHYNYDSHIATAMAWYLSKNPTADEHEPVKPEVVKEETTEDKNPVKTEKTQYGYYHYTDGEGDYAVCAHYGQENDGWKNIYREEIWVDEPLKLVSNSATSLKHPEVSGCHEAGCLEGDFWTSGGRYVDEEGIVWYRQQTRTVSQDTNETKSFTVIKEAPSIVVSDAITLTEGTKYSFKNVSSGWHMNVRGAGKSNGTQINLWPLDMSEPNTQCYTINVVSEEEKTFMISPVCAPDMYIDVRHGGKALAPAQLISLWEADGDTTKEIVVEMLEDGSCYLTFKDNRNYCIGAKSKTAAETKLTQLVVCKKTGAAEQRWYLCDETGSILGNKQEILPNTSETDVALQKRMEELVEKLLQGNRLVSGNSNASSPYFTTTGKSVASADDDKCRNDYVIKADWFKKTFGDNINASNFPKHLAITKDNNIGWSCFGFACFGQWYLYKENNTDKITAERVAEGTYTKAFLQNNLKTGDVIRIKISDSLSHSMIFHSFTENGIMVLDSNFAGDNKVRLGEVKYNRTNWVGDPVYIYRVTE